MKFMGRSVISGIIRYQKVTHSCQHTQENKMVTAPAFKNNSIFSFLKDAAQFTNFTGLQSYNHKLEIQHA